MPPDSDQRPLPVEDYLERVLARIEPMPSFEHPLMDAIGLPVADDVHAPVSLPVFDNSGMDGYAVAFKDVADATAERPLHLPVVGEIAAGQTQIFTLTPGTAVRIMTGAPIPEGCTAVVPFEWTEESGREVLVRQAPEEGQHIRFAGEEVKQGRPAAAPGRGDRHPPGRAARGARSRSGADRAASPRGGDVDRHRARRAGTAAGARQHLRLQQLPARRRGAVRTAAIAYRVRASSDDPASFTEALSDQLVRADLVVTSGGVSKGTHDVVKEVLSELGTVDFLEVAMQPGKPQGFGVVGEDATPIFTLPGNPVSAYVSFEMFVVPALHKLTGRANVGRRLVTGTVTTAAAVDAGQAAAGAREVALGAAGVRVTPVGGAGSHLIAGLAQADALIVLAEGVTRVEQGDEVPVLLLDRP